MFVDGPEKFLGHLTGANLVGVRKIVARRRRRSPDAGQGAGVEPQRVANIVEPDAMSQLREEQREDVTPRFEGPGFLFSSRFPG